MNFKLIIIPVLLALAAAAIFVTVNGQGQKEITELQARQAVVGYQYNFSCFGTPSNYTIEAKNILYANKTIGVWEVFTDEAYDSGGQYPVSDYDPSLRFKVNAVTGQIEDVEVLVEYC